MKIQTLPSSIWKPSNSDIRFFAGISLSNEYHQEQKPHSQHAGVSHLSLFTFLAKTYTLREKTETSSSSKNQYSTFVKHYLCILGHVTNSEPQFLCYMCMTVIFS